ncbi:MAG TPA: hypothetical protein VK043_01630 [Burkholderiales bacterium]|nr:hypothetical protein [Burkholderiales bacterium]
MKALLALLVMACLATGALAQEKTESRELVGHMGSREALLVLHAVERADGGWHLTGEYLVLGTLERRYLEGERGPELGATALRESLSAIPFGRAPVGELRGTWREGVFRGTRLGPGGQSREDFVFREAFPSMKEYTATVSCTAGASNYASSLAYSIEAGKLAGDLEWASRTANDGHICKVVASTEAPMEGGLRFVDGECAVTLRRVGEESIRVAAENCTSRCGSGAYLEPLLVDERGRCRLLRPAPR